MWLTLVVAGVIDRSSSRVPVLQMVRESAIELFYILGNRLY